MGVVYKLTKEIAGFIVDQKTKTPNLSCRKLAEIVHQKFEFHVSKSSINAILKEAQLSSPVGRRTRSGKRPPKFRIPESRKAQIFENKEFEKDESPKATPAPKPPPPKKERKVPLVEKVTAASQESRLYDGLGAIFLKAAEWELSDRPILGQLLQGYSKGQEQIPLDIAGEILIFLKYFGLESIDKLSQYEGQGLWALSSPTGKKIETRTIRNVINKTQNFEEILLNFSIEIPQLLSELNYTKMFLEDGTTLCIDAQTTSLWSENVPESLSFPVNKVMTSLVKQWMANTDPVILGSLSKEDQFSTEVFDFISACDNIPGKRIEKLATCDFDHNEISSFESLLQERRIFIGSIWPWQKEFNKILKSEQNNQALSPGKNREEVDRDVRENVVLMPVSDEKIYYKDINFFLTSETSPGFQKECRVLLLRKAPEESPVAALMTNAEREAVSAEKIVSLYLNRWPSLGEGGRGVAVKKQPIISQVIKEQVLVQEEMSEKPSCQENFQQKSNVFDKNLYYENDINDLISRCEDLPGLAFVLADILNRYCQKHFFSDSYNQIDITTIVPSIYKLPGFITEKDGFIKINIVFSEGSDFEAQAICRKTLELAVQRVNERAIYDNQGRRVFLGLDVIRC